MRRDLVSVIIPCHNYGRFLPAAVESVRNQTYAPIEIIVVDDGSTDDTAAIAARLGVQVLSGPRQGVCTAVNRGFLASSGHFIMRLDADDVIAPTYVERMVGALYDQPRAALAYSHGQYFGAAHGPFRLEPFSPESLAEGAYVTCLAVMRRDAFEQAGLYDPGMASVRCEDWDLWLTLAESGQTGVLVDQTLWSYRRHERPSRNTWDLLSLAGLRRELRLIARLQDKHPRVFATAALRRRLGTLPARLARRQIAPRHALLLVLFYVVMLGRSAWRVIR